MEPQKLESPDRTLAKDQPEYIPLDILDVEDSDGINMMCSFWKPSEGELEALNKGYHIVLGIAGAIHPPVRVFVHHGTGLVKGCEE